MKNAKKRIEEMWGPDYREWYVRRGELEERWRRKRMHTITYGGDTYETQKRRNRRRYTNEFFQPLGQEGREEVQAGMAGV